MKDAFTRLLSSAKFWTTVIGMLVTAGATLLARYGLEVSTEAVQQTAVTVAALFGILLHAQGRADQGKHAAAATAVLSTPPVTTQNVTVNESKPAA